MKVNRRLAKFFKKTGEKVDKPPSKVNGYIAQSILGSIVMYATNAVMRYCWTESF